MKLYTSGELSNKILSKQLAQKTKNTFIMQQIVINHNNDLNKDVVKYKTSIIGSTDNLVPTADGYDANKEGTKKLRFLCH